MRAVGLALERLAFFVVAGLSVVCALPWEDDGDASCSSTFRLENQTFALNTSHLRLSAECYTGTIPTEFGLLTAVTYFHFGQNSLSGRFPSEIGLLKYARELSVGQNTLTGTLPTEIGGLTRLMYGGSESTDFFSYNQMTGTIPTQLGRLTGITYSLVMASNAFNGTLPTEIGKLNNLLFNFEVQDLSLTGQLPTEIGNLNYMLSSFQLQNNKFIGHMPTELGRLDDMQDTFYTTSNQFCNDLPTEVSAISSHVNEWKITSGNMLGTPCCEVFPNGYTCVPTPVPTLLPSISCASGTYLDTDGFCYNCAIGRYTNNSGGAPFATECVDCPIGRYNIKTGSGTCEQCGSGKFSSEDRSSCSDCPAGTYVYNEQSCEACTAGTYAPSALTDACLECAAGFSTGVAKGATTCSSCDGGTYSSKLAVNCSTCGEGTFSGSSSSACTECDAGKYSAAGASSCTSCAAGTYQEQTGASKCHNCTRGTYASSVASTSCEMCPSAKYADQVGTTSCESCPTPTSGYKDGAVECDYCIKGYFKDPKTGSCKECPENADDTLCDGVTLPAPNENFWNDRSDPENIHIMLPCWRGSVCVGSKNHSAWTLNAFNNDSRWGHDIVCEEGSYGALCGACMPDYTFDSQKGYCVHCDKLDLVELVKPYAIAAAVFVATASVIYKFRHELRPLVAWLYRGRVSKLREAMFSHANLKIILVTFQIVCSTSFTLDVTFPTVFTRYLEILNVLAFDMFGNLSLGCIKAGIPMYLVYILISSIIPMVLVAVIWIVYFMRIACARRMRRSKQLDLQRQHVGYTLFITYLVLPTVSQAQFKGLNCLTLASGKMYLRVDTSIECTTEPGPFTTIVGVTVPLICLYQSIPIVWAYCLYAHRARLNPPMKDPQRAYQKREDDSTVAHLAFLFADYRCKMYYYEVIEMYRRILLLGILPFIERSVVRAGVGCLLAAFGCVLFRELLPYHHYQANTLALAAQYQVWITFVGAFVVLSNDLSADDNFLGLGLLIANIVILPMMTYLGGCDMKEQEAKIEREQKLKEQLLRDKAEDKAKFEKAWHRLCEELIGSEQRVLKAAAELARRHPEKPKQLNTFDDVDQLISEAEAADEPMHAAMRELVEGFHGHYERGPLKKKPRILEKMYADYDGDPRRVVDVVRASALFTSMLQLALAIEALLADGCPLVVVRAKDRFNHPTSFGYSDFLLNVRLKDGQHVGELQLHLSAIHAIKPACHRTYAVLRAVGWEDDEIENKDKDNGKDEDQEDEEGEGEGGEAYIARLGKALAPPSLRQLTSWRRPSAKASFTATPRRLKRNSTWTDKWGTTPGKETDGVPTTLGDEAVQAVPRPTGNFDAMEIDVVIEEDATDLDSQANCVFELVPTIDVSSQSSAQTAVL